MIVPVAAIVTGILLACFETTAHAYIYGAIRALPIDGLLYTYNHLATAGTVVAIVFMIWFLDPARRPTIGVLLLAILASSSVVEPVKQITGRARPPFSVTMEAKHAAELEADYIPRFPDNPKIRATREDKWLWMGSLDRPFFDGGFSSFPSGHAAGAFVLASFLTILYARLWGLWFTIATLCAISRIHMRRHFPSDVLVGAGIGYLMANLIYSLPAAHRFGLWFEGVFGRVLYALGLGEEPAPQPVAEHSIAIGPDPHHALLATDK